jgi:hypothetical protein
MKIRHIKKRNDLRLWRASHTGWSSAAIAMQHMAETMQQYQEWLLDSLNKSMNLNQMFASMNSYDPADAVYAKILDVVKGIDKPVVTLDELLTGIINNETQNISPDTGIGVGHAVTTGSKPGTQSPAFSTDPTGTSTQD